MGGVVDGEGFLICLVRAHVFLGIHRQVMLVHFDPAEACISVPLLSFVARVDLGPSRLSNTESG